MTKQTTDWPVSSSMAPIAAHSATFGCETTADSISAVDMRWPDTLSTSSTRPMTQKKWSSSWREASPTKYVCGPNFSKYVET